MKKMLNVCIYLHNVVNMYIPTYVAPSRHYKEWFNLGFHMIVLKKTQKMFQTSSIL